MTKTFIICKEVQIAVVKRVGHLLDGCNKYQALVVRRHLCTFSRIKSLPGSRCNIDSSALGMHTYLAGPLLSEVIRTKDRDQMCSVTKQFLPWTDQDFLRSMSGYEPELCLDSHCRGLWITSLLKDNAGICAGCLALCCTLATVREHRRFMSMMTEAHDDGGASSRKYTAEIQGKASAISRNRESVKASIVSIDFSSAMLRGLKAVSLIACV